MSSSPAARIGLFFILAQMLAVSAGAIYQPLVITPEGDLLITGYYEEPATYTPTSVEYTLINYQTNQMRVDIAVDVTWLSAPTFINVPGSGEGLPQPRYIDVALQPEAYDLTPGIYIGTIAFTHDLRNGDIPQIITVILHVKVRLCEALDNCDLEFTTGGDAEWYGQWAENHYDGDAAQSGALPETTQATWLETEIDNLGDLTFWWRVSSETQYAPLELWINDELIDSISGEVGWVENTIHLGSNPFYIANGYNKVRWQYAKYRAYPVGADAGWVDYVSFEAEDYLTVSPSAPAVYEKCLPVNLAELNTTSTTTYTLSNTGSASLNWSAEVSEGWVALSAVSGTLAAGATATVNVTFTAGVEGLLPDAHGVTVVFTNESSGYDIPRSINLLLSNEIPPVPSAPSPVNGADNVSPTAIVLSWDGGDVPGCNTYYQVYFGTAPGSLALVYEGIESSCALPEQQELTTYYWRVDSENCCGTPAQSSPVWSFETGAFNALVYFVSCGGGQNYAASALANQNFLPLIVTDATAFVDRLASRDWEIVIVDVLGASLTQNVITALTAYYTSGGHVIFSHADLGAYSDNDFLDRAGVTYVESYSVPRNVYSWMPMPMFALPNEVPDVTGFLFTNTCPISGHLITLAETTTAYAGYTQAAQEDMAAIAVNADGRIIFNAFAPQTAMGDQNSNGKPDMVELYENQIVFVTPFGCDPDETPPEIELLGANPTTLECGSDYVSPGVFAWDRCDGLISEWVVIDDSALDAGVEGTYTVYYYVTDSVGNTSITLERTVQVVDTTAPFIALLGSNPFLLECERPYESPGVFAWDDCDGIISEQVVVDTSSIEEGVVYYSVTDGAGHASEVLERMVEVVESEPPVITLVSENPMVLECGEVYVDPGATAENYCDGDLTAAIVVGGDAVDSAAVGLYVVVYNVTDSLGKEADEVSRTVEVVNTTVPVITPPAAYVPIECAEFNSAFEAVTDAFAVTAANQCGDVTADIRVLQIKVTYPRKGDEITYTVASLNTDLIQAGKITGVEGAYTGTLAETITIFQNYFLFKPAIYEVTYVVQNSEAEAATQVIRIDDQCRGPLGCYSCDSCAQQRPLPSAKELLSDWLLVGLSVLVLASLSKSGIRML